MHVPVGWVIVFRLRRAYVVLGGLLIEFSAAVFFRNGGEVAKRGERRVT